MSPALDFWRVVVAHLWLQQSPGCILLLRMVRYKRQRVIQVRQQIKESGGVGELQEKFFSWTRTCTAC